MSTRTLILLLIAAAVVVAVAVSMRAGGAIHWIRVIHGR
jgi:hypothetical protein